MLRIILLLTCFFALKPVFTQDLQWAKNFGGTNYDQARSLTTDNKGNVYITGLFFGTSDFDPGSGTTNLTAAGVADIYITKFDASGNLIWVKAIGGGTFDEMVYSITTDDSGMVYITGFFEGIVDFNPNAGTNNISSEGYRDVFVLKLDSDGDFIWAKNLGGSKDDGGRSIVIDKNGNVIVGGYFNAISDFDPGANSFNLSSNGGYDIFIVKLKPTGEFIWAKSVGGTGTEYLNSLVIDNLNNIFATGSFQGVVDFNPDKDTFNLISGIGYIVKLKTTGEFSWANGFGGEGNSLTVDRFSTTYVTVVFRGKSDFDSGNGTFFLTATGNNPDIFISKFNDLGNFAWAKRFGGTGNDAAQSITIDWFGNVYFTGHYYGPADFNPNADTLNLISVKASRDIFVSKLSSSGNLIWARSIGGPGYEEYGYSINLDKNNNIYICGYFEGTSDFDPDTSKINLTSNGKTDIFVIKLSDPSLSIKKLEQKRWISIFPNPTNRDVYVQLDESFIGKKISLLDNTGLVLMSSIIYTSQLNLKLDNLSNGIYYINVEGNIFRRISLIQED